MNGRGLDNRVREIEALGGDHGVSFEETSGNGGDSAEDTDDSAEVAEDGQVVDDGGWCGCIKEEAEHATEELDELRGVHAGVGEDIEIGGQEEEGNWEVDCGGVNWVAVYKSSLDGFNEQRERMWKCHTYFHRLCRVRHP